MKVGPRFLISQAAASASPHHARKIGAWLRRRAAPRTSVIAATAAPRITHPRKIESRHPYSFSCID